ncbi:MAG: hypothetical protein KAJ20_01875 [Candidatus Aenigmarchaeota archaeon]|nr:hypothetical protein [Candidatus Aenigmarchaeota archaeon]
MEDPDKKIYTMISFINKLNQGEGVYPDVLFHNMKTITGIDISDKDFEHFLRADILTTGYDKYNRPTVLLSSGAQSYLGSIDEAWLRFPEMRTALKDRSAEIDIPYSKRKRQSTQACPIGLDKKRCETAWKETESIIYQKQKDIPGAKLLLSKIYPEIVVKPKKNDIIDIDNATFEDIYSLLQEDIFDKKYKRSTALEKSWYDYIYINNKDGISINVPAYIKQREESGINIDINDIEIHLIKKKIEPLYQQICGSGKKN